MTAASSLFAPPPDPASTLFDEADVIVDRGEYIAAFSPCRLYRYSLTMETDSDGPPGVFVMLNPSTADAEQLDPTLRRCRNFAAEFGWGRLTICNLFAFRATDPKRMKAAAEPIGRMNDEVIAATVTAAEGRVLVGWGVHGSHRGRSDSLLASIRAAGIEPLALGVTKSGQPRHPLYLPKGLRPLPYLELLPRG